MKTAEDIREEIVCIDGLKMERGFEELLTILTTWKEDICKKYTDTFWFDVFNERYPDEVKEILDGRMSGPDF